MDESDKRNARVNNNKLMWVTSAGGPLLLLEESLLPYWNGIDTSDYERACSIRDYLGLLSVGQGQALVLGEEPMPTAWRPFINEQGGMIIRWQWANDDNDVIESINKLQQPIWENTGIILSVSSDPLMLFDAACPGQDADCNKTGCKLSINLTQGKYSIETAHYRPDENTALILHRLMPKL
jgi:hypothetical protein